MNFGHQIKLSIYTFSFQTVMSVLVLVSHCLTIFTILVALVKLSRTKFLTTHPDTTPADEGSKIITDSR